MVKVHHLTRQCPWCGEEIDISQKDIGETILCPICKKKITVRIAGFFSKNLVVEKGSWF